MNSSEVIVFKATVQAKSVGGAEMTAFIKASEVGDRIRKKASM